MASARAVLRTRGPMVMLGTKRPSMTSTWIQSQPALSIACTCSPSLEKLALRGGEEGVQLVVTVPTRCCTRRWVGGQCAQQQGAHTDGSTAGGGDEKGEAGGTLRQAAHLRMEGDTMTSSLLKESTDTRPACAAMQPSRAAAVRHPPSDVAGGAAAAAARVGYGRCGAQAAAAGGRAAAQTCACLYHCSMLASSAATTPNTSGAVLQCPQACGTWRQAAAPPPGQPWRSGAAGAPGQPQCGGCGSPAWRGP